MKQEIDTTPEYVVFTVNPELEPQLRVYEIERGSFPTKLEAERFAETMFAQGVEAVQISERKWVQLTIPKHWYPASHYEAAKRFNTTVVHD